MCSAVFANALEVIKTRIMNEALLFGDIKKEQRKPQNRLKHQCQSLLCHLRHVLKNEGIGSIFRGVGYQASMSVTRSIILFPLYEVSKPSLTQ